jgi:aryl-alcohol dehydrogenase-like predicted oxidoreductase
MLRFPLIHPPLLAALAACGHGGKVLLADANYSHSTNVHPGATTIYLNLRPGLLTVHQVLEPLLQAVPVEAADVMTSGDGTELLDTSAAAELLPLCADRGVQVLAGGVFNSGILADPRNGAHYDYAPAPAEVLARARRIRDICAAYGVPVGAAALRFTLRHPAVTAAVVGACSAAEITADASYLTLDIPDELFAALATV